MASRLRYMYTLPTYALYPISCHIKAMLRPHAVVEAEPLVAHVTPASFASFVESRASDQGQVTSRESDSTANAARAAWWLVAERWPRAPALDAFCHIVCRRCEVLIHKCSMRAKRACVDSKRTEADERQRCSTRSRWPRSRACARRILVQIRLFFSGGKDQHRLM